MKIRAIILQSVWTFNWLVTGLWVERFWKKGYKGPNECLSVITFWNQGYHI